MADFGPILHVLADWGVIIIKAGTVALNARDGGS
jgi:hypothetical protein